MNCRSSVLIPEHASDAQSIRGASDQVAEVFIILLLLLKAACQKRADNLLREEAGGGTRHACQKAAEGTTYFGI